MVSRRRSAAPRVLSHALAAAERGFAVFPLSRSKQPALPSPHRAASPAPATRMAEAVPAHPGDQPGAPSPHPREGRAPDDARREDSAGARPQPCRGECGRPGHGVHDATLDPRRIRSLFALAPWATGYGIACGLPPHRLIGLDLDTKGGADPEAELRALEARYGFTVPRTVLVLTPSGGRHLWLTGPEGPGAPAVPNSAGRLAPGIDVRGGGGYLVGPGSRTAHGVYRFAPGTPGLPPAPVPPALLRLLLPPPPRPLPVSPAAAWPDDGEALVRFVLASRPGERNARLYWAARRAHERGLRPDLTARLTEAAARTGLSLREAEQTIRSAAGSG